MPLEGHVGAILSSRQICEGQVAAFAGHNAFARQQRMNTDVGCGWNMRQEDAAVACRWRCVWCMRQLRAAVVCGWSQLVHADGICGRCMQLVYATVACGWRCGWSEAESQEKRNWVKHAPLGQ